MGKVEIVSNPPSTVTFTVIDGVIGGHVVSRRVLTLPGALLRAPVVQSTQPGTGADVAVGF